MKRSISTHVDCHNITMITGWLFSLLPIGELAFRVNLVSAFYGSLAVIMFYFTLIEFSKGRKLIAAVGSLFLMLSHSMWWHSTILESYATNAFFTTLGLFYFTRLNNKHNHRDLYILCTIAGLSIFNHVSMGFFCIGAAITGTIFAAKKAANTSKTIINCFAFAILGLSPWLVVFIRDWMSFDSLSLAINHAFFGPFKGIMLGGTLQSNLTDLSHILILDHPSPFLALIPLGAWALAKQWGLYSPSFSGLFVQMMITSIFAWTYQTWNKFSHGQPALVIYTFYGCVGFLWLVTKIEQNTHSKKLHAKLIIAIGMLCALMPTWIYTKLPLWSQNPSSMWYSSYNDQYAVGAYSLSEYILNPNKFRFNEYEKFSKLVFERLPQNSILFEDDSRTYYQLADYYQKYLKFRPDVSIIMINSFGYDEIQWGETPSHVAQTLIEYYFQNRPFYTTSLEYPFSRVLEAVPGMERMRFEKVMLDDSHWVFRLVTEAEEPNAFLSLASENWSRKKPILFEKMNTLHNVTADDVFFGYRETHVIQNMRTYGQFWKNEDQLFIRGEGIGSWIELQVESPNESQVRLSFNFTTSYDYGIIDIFLNESLIISDLDLYSPDIFHKITQTDTLTIRPGRNRLVFKVKGSNPRSQDHIFGIDYIEFQTQ